MTFEIMDDLFKQSLTDMGLEMFPDNGKKVPKQTTRRIVTLSQINPIRPLYLNGQWVEDLDAFLETRHASMRVQV